MEEARGRLELAQKSLELLRANPGMTAEQLADLLEKHRRQLQERLSGIELDMCRGNMTRLLPEHTRCANEQELEQYRSRCKQVLRDIWRQAHPDAVRNNPAAENLTDRQRRQLDELAAQANTINHGELKYHPDQVGWSMRSLSRLHEIRRRIENIFGSAGLELDAEYIIRGDSLEEKTAWLGTECRRLQEGIEQAKQELVRLCNDTAISQYRLQLARQSRYREIKQFMLDEAARCRREAGRLDTVLKSMLTAGEGCGHDATE
jgi:hypothetical protein